MRRFFLCAIATMTFFSAASETSGDEGMYLFNDLPAEQLKSRYGFEPTEAWADALRLSSVRFNSGGSGSFISSDGLVLTNHHVASDTLHKLSTPERNLIDDGYLAKSTDQELKAPDLELNQLVSIEDVTDRVNAAVSKDASVAESAKQRRAVIADIEKESTDKTGFRSDVVTLFGGAKYHLYRYKKYTDVRLVWAPETAAAFFGGDADNFEYPRFCLDATIMRVYEDGKPAQAQKLLTLERLGCRRRRPGLRERKPRSNPTHLYRRCTEVSPRCTHAVHPGLFATQRGTDATVRSCRRRSHTPGT